MYRSPPLRQEQKIVEDTTDDEAHAKDHKARERGRDCWILTSIREFLVCL